MSAPTLRTARLTLGMPSATDLENCAAMWAAPEIYAMIGGHAFTREEVWHRILRYVGHWQIFGYGTWIVRETDGGAFVGSVGLMDSRRDTIPSFEGTPEAGWVLAPHAQGRGYAAEALAAMFAWADLRMPRTVCIIDPANTRSIRLAERLGHRLLAEARYRDRTVLLFERHS